MSLFAIKITQYWIAIGISNELKVKDLMKYYFRKFSTKTKELCQSQPISMFVKTFNCGMRREKRRENALSEKKNQYLVSYIYPLFQFSLIQGSSRGTIHSTSSYNVKEAQ